MTEQEKQALALGLVAVIALAFTVAHLVDRVVRLERQLDLRRPLPSPARPRRVLLDDQVLEELLGDARRAPGPARAPDDLLEVLDLDNNVIAAFVNSRVATRG